MTNAGEHPEPARLTVRLGVTGHRRDDLVGAVEDELRAAVSAVLEEVSSAAAAIHVEAGALYDCKLPLLRVISPLAEGADTLVAEEALRLGYELQAVLPFPREACIEDFADQDSVALFDSLLEQSAALLELDGPTGEELRVEAYYAVGQEVLRQSDVLVVIWDGRSAKGIGGTGQIVGEAADLELPTLWINSTPPHQIYLREADGEGKIVLSDLHLLSVRLRSSLLLPAERDPDHQANAGAGTSELRRAQRYLREKRPRWTLSIFFDLFHHLWAWNWKPLQIRLPDLRQSGARSWPPGWRTLAALRPEIANRLEQDYLQHFHWADALAMFYAGRYRSAFVLVYLLGALAVLVAFLGVHSGYHPWFVVEVALILSILGITYLGRRQCWHERWLDYRLLAENLRQIQVLDLVGRVPSSFKVPAKMEVGDPRRSWFNWYFRSLVRQAGMVSTRLDHPYLARYRQVLDESIQTQMVYHDTNCRTHHAVHRRAHLVVQGLFYLAFVVALVHVGPVEMVGLPRVFLDVLVVALPGFGGALGAILLHGEFDRVAARSRALRPRLEQLKADLTRAGTTSRELGRIAEGFADLALAELMDWRFVFLEKNLVLPS